MTTERKERPPGAETLICDADLVQAGFHPAEVSEEGVAFRWIGPAPRATVFLPPLGGAAVDVALRVHTAFVPEVLEEVRLSLDGGPWVPVLLRQDAGGTVLSARLRHGPLAHLGALRLEIDCIRAESPRARGGTDDRPLSIALAAIDVSAARG